MKKKINDLDLANWKQYEDILTDSLWLIDKRDHSGTHKGDYHGNFIPQIPYQLMMRYTKKNDWVLDPFLGSGTTLIECERLGRNGIGIELNKEILEIAKERAIKKDTQVKLEFLLGNSMEFDLKPILEKNKIKEVQLIICHPPYWDIIEFNQLKGNLANANSLEEFLVMFEKVINQTCQYLEKGRYIGIVIGDIYKKGEWIPLGSYLIQMMIRKGYLLKSTVVKNMSETKAKQNQKAIWRYRSLLGGFYVFAHEYILIFQKPEKEKKNKPLL